MVVGIIIIIQFMESWASVGYDDKVAVDSAEQNAKDGQQQINNFNIKEKINSFSTRRCCGNRHN